MGAVRRRLPRQRATAFGAAVIAGVIFLVGWGQVGRWREERDLQAIRRDVAADLAVHRDALASAVANRLALLEGLRAFVEVNLARGIPLEEQYRDFAGRLYAFARGTRNLAVTQGSVYRLVYPVEGNESVIGYDLLADQRVDIVRDARRAIAERDVVVSGPIDLRQGGVGIVARRAVYKDGVFWGLAAIAVDLRPILQDAGLLPEDARTDTAVRRPGSGAFFGPASLFHSDAVVQRVVLPDGYWEIAARPSGGWGVALARPRRLWLLSGALLSLVPMGLVFLVAWRQSVLRAAKVDAERRVQEGTSRLAQTMELLQGVLRASPLPIVAFDDHGVVQVWNAAAERVFGWTAQEAIGQRNPIVPADAITEFDAYQQRTRSGETISGLDLRRVRKDGTAIDIRLFTAPVVGPDGRVVGVMGLAEDLTERNRIGKLVEETRQELERRQREMLENIQLLAVMLDRDGRITFCNSHLARVTGWTREELTGRDWFDTFVPAAIRAAVRDGFMQALEAGSTADQAESVVVTRDGEVRDIAWDNTILRDLAGRVVGRASFGRDVTEQRQLEAQYRQAQKMEAVGQLAGGIAHDFNNLLQVITGYVSLALADVGPDEPLYPELTEIRRAGERATVLVRQLLAFSRRQKIERRAIDVNEAIADLLKMLRRLIGEHIELDFGPGYDVHAVLADPGLLEQVLMNLCVNARDAMPDGGRISISTANVRVGREFVEQRAWGQEGEYVLLTVADTGPGIPPALHDRIFEPFFTTKEIGKGTGLGLATVYGIVKQHEGMIELASDVPTGATFRVYLPIAEKPAVRDETASPVPGGPTSGQGTILLAEDEELVRNLARRVLEGGGYRVLVARDGAEALALVDGRAAEIDLALLDVVMPKASGREVSAHIKTLRPDLPVMFCSGYNRQMLDESGMPEEGVELILKPYEPKVLLQRVHARLARQAEGACELRIEK